MKLHTLRGRRVVLFDERFQMGADPSTRVWPCFCHFDNRGEAVVATLYLPLTRSFVISTNEVRRNLNTGAKISRFARNDRVKFCLNERVPIKEHTQISQDNARTVRHLHTISGKTGGRDLNLLQDRAGRFAPDETDSGMISIRSRISWRIPAPGKMAPRLSIGAWFSDSRGSHERNPNRQVCHREQQEEKIP